ncbi:transient receptor potential cation channel subfamily M member 1-like [Ptychodera flava]|uniref:transient receptor potential cation channel subfamily M member 1-like n=1 Tax=Ptychodera flava TaxID=63121 RepID=UPI00396A0901
MFCLGTRSRVDSVISVDGSEGDEQSVGYENAQLSVDEDESVMDLGAPGKDLHVADDPLRLKLFKALKNDRVESTETLMKMRGKINITTFSREYLQELYYHVIVGDRCPPWLKSLAIKLKMNVPESQRADTIVISIGDMLCRLLPEQFQNRFELGAPYMSSTEIEKANAAGYMGKRCCGNDEFHKRVYGVRDLFFWALLSDRQRLAVSIFNSGWIESDRSSLIGASLSAAKLLNKLSDMAQEFSNQHATDLNVQARRYKGIANYVMSECFEEDRKKTQQMVLKNRPQWGNESFLVISSYLEGKESESFRIVLNDLWTGKLEDSKYLTIKLFLCVVPIFGFLLKVPDVHFLNLPAKLKAYYTSPATKFMLNFLSYGFHILIFSHFLLTDFSKADHWLEISIWEKLVIIWVFGMAMEEIRQLTEFGAIGPVQILLNLVEYYISNWNSIDWIMMWTFYVGLILRFTVSVQFFYVARILYCISLILMYFRLLQCATIWEYLGPKVSMIKVMMTRDLPPFLIVFFVFFMSFGVVYHALLYPNDFLSLDLVAEVLALPYWQLYGEIQLDIVEGEADPGCTRNISIARSNPDVQRCPESEDYPWLVPILTGIYMLVSNILLLNLLIAVFNQTYSDAEQESSKIHRYNQYGLVEEYLARPILPPPLNVVELLILRPIATLFISCHWQIHKQGYRCRPHLCNLFKLLIMEKEVDPDLWERCSAGPSIFKYGQTVKEYIQMQQRELDQSAQAITTSAQREQPIGNDKLVRQMNEFHQKMKQTEEKIELLQDSIDNLEQRIVGKLLENQSQILSRMLGEYTEKQGNQLSSLTRRLSMTSQTSLVNPEQNDQILSELNDLKTSTKSAWARLTNSVKKNRRLLKDVIEENEQRKTHIPEDE